MVERVMREFCAWAMTHHSCAQRWSVPTSAAVVEHAGLDSANAIVAGEWTEHFSSLISHGSHLLLNFGGILDLWLMATTTTCRYGHDCAQLASGHVIGK